MMWLLLAMLGCAGNIHELYDAARDEALRPAAAASGDWSPDVRVHLRPAALRTVTTTALDAGILAWDKPIKLDTPLGAALTLRPSAAVDSLRLVPGRDCDGCLRVTGDVVGRVRGKIAQRPVSLQFTASLDGIVTLAVEDTGDGFQVRGRLTEVRKLQLGGDQTLARIDVSGPIKKWVRKALAAAPAFTVAELGGDKLPLRGARIRTAPGGIFVDALSDVAGAPVGEGGALPAGTDWEVRIAEESLAAMLRRAAFEAGTIDFDVAIDPQSIDLEGDRFALRLRLWRLAGRGWWRDYDVSGGVEVRKRKLVLEATDAEEAGKSKGAGLADPIALLAERRILEAITDNMQQAIPGTKRASVGGIVLKAQTDRFYGDGAAAVLHGVLESRAVGD